MRKNMKRTMLTAFVLLLAVTLQAQKRVNNRLYNPDPAPVVSGDRLYVFTGHDLDTATYFRMPDWQVFSTTDMEHWTDHGIVLSTANFKWAKQGDNAWASQAIERNGKWYWYVAAEDTTKHIHGIGVAVADRPEGPWADALGKPLIPGDWGFIDPTVFIDDDGQAWLFWGNNGCWYAKLNEDMISIDKSFANNGICDMRSMLDDEAQFGPKCLKMDYQLHKKVMKTGFEEAPWIYKIGDTYFLEYAAGGVPEHWAYSTSKSIHGPWHYEGRITDESPGSFTIHGGTIDFKGKSYLFYHDGIPSGGNGFRRTTAFREFQRMKDGRIPKIDIQAQPDLDDQYATELLKVGTEAPDFKMKTPDGKTIQLSEYAKGKTVVLDFWASWCPDCRKDAPEVVRQYEKYHQYGIEFIGISMDTNVEAWKKAIEKFGITYPQVSELKKFKETDIAKAYGVKWIPSMVVVGPDGKVKLSTVMTDKLDNYLKELTTDLK